MTFRTAFLALVSALLLGTSASAATVSLYTTSTGASNPPLLNQSTYINGDFLVQRCCGDATINNATEEYVRWSMDVSSQFTGTVTSINSATLQLQFRTGGDTPWDDEFSLSNGMINQIRTPFGFTNTFTNYNRSLNLVSLFGEAFLVDLLNGNPVLTFRTSNDSYSYGAQLSISAEVAAPVPLPASALLLVFGLFGLFVLRRRGTA
ncbi:hypothetical protein [Pacificoceanicola onchidii]|uniref:hypothetical protein n=1 Tax=Pacificoceanicola onchidii TaxID=2562685 RepID=UPI0010A40F02|nr:hypothetical protein [Pacificoceanicola onchidii]